MQNGKNGRDNSTAISITLVSHKSAAYTGLHELNALVAFSVSDRKRLPKSIFEW
jgi:hypothetical protein